MEVIECDLAVVFLQLQHLVRDSSDAETCCSVDIHFYSTSVRLLHCSTNLVKINAKTGVSRLKRFKTTRRQSVGSSYGPAEFRSDQNRGYKLVPAYGHICRMSHWKKVWWHSGILSLFNPIRPGLVKTPSVFLLPMGMLVNRVKINTA